MNISQTFIERPIATSLLMAAIALFGAVAYRALPVSDLPNVDLPTLLVTASLPGASPDTMASAVATPLENQFSTIAGLDSMTSSNSLGNTQITLEFDLSRKLDGAAVDVQAAITQASRLLPQGMPTPPTFTKVNPADQPILYLALTSPTLPLVDARRVRRDAHRAAHLDDQRRGAGAGAGRAEVRRARADGSRTPWPSRQIGINEVETALKNWNVNLPTGAIIGPQRAFTLQASGQLTERRRSTGRWWWPTATARRCAWRNSATSSTAWRTIRPRPGSTRTRAAERAIVLAIQRQPGTNTIEVTDGIKNLLPVFQQRDAAVGEHGHSVRPVGHHPRVLSTTCEFTMVLTLGLVVMVIFLFLRNVSATIIPSLALPFSIIGTFAVMYLLDYSLDNLSMMALILSIGFVVDDAIVMLENIVRHMEMGEKPLQAALKGSARDRLHHRFDDAVAGGGVHPGAVHGRHAGAAVQGIRGHHLRGDPDFGRGVGDADADAVQPLPAQPRTKQQRGWFYRLDREVLRRHAARLRRHAAMGAALPRADHG